MEHYIPFVAIGGVATDTDDQQQGAFTFPTVIDSPLSALAAQAITKRSDTSGPWLPGAQRLHIASVPGLHLPEKTVPSLLSPKNPQSALYPDGIFTAQWIKKYTDLIPTTVVLFVKLTGMNAREIETSVEDLRVALRAARSHIFVVVDVSGLDEDPTTTNTRLNALRRTTGLAPRSGLVCIDGSTDIEAFAETTVALLTAQAADFFAARSRETRHKRASQDPENADLWEARYTLKLALFAEFKADYEGAIRLYQSAYDCLLVLQHARQWLCMCAGKICLFLIYYQRYGLAWRKFQHHIKLSSEPSWLAQQYEEFADMLKYSTVEGWAIAPTESVDPSSALPRPGFLYLRAAKLAEAPEVIQRCYEKAVEDFAALPHTRSSALASYADWLSSTSGDSAQVYERALKTLPHNSVLHERIAQKLMHVSPKNPMAGFFLFHSGKHELPETAELGAIEMPLFDAQGTFMVDNAFVGKALRCQLSLSPTFQGSLTLKSIKVQFSCGSVLFTHSDQSQSQSFVSIKDQKRDEPISTNLAFSSKRTFEFSVWPNEVGECEFVDVQIHSEKPSFDQRLLIKPTTSIATDQGDRHLRIVASRSIEVQTRPQRLSVETTDIPTVLLSQETTSFDFSILNQEDEKASVKVVASYTRSDREDDEEVQFYESSSDINARGTHKFSVEKFHCPASPFSIRITTSYTTPSNAASVSNTVSAEVDVIKPFRTNFVLSPELHKEDWPNLFVPSDHCQPLPLIRRRWNLKATVLNMSGIDIVVTQREFECVSSQALITALSSKVDVHEFIKSNDQSSTELHFEAMRKDRDIRNFEAETTLRIRWNRHEEPKITNEFVVPRLRITLPNQEPRVMMCVDKDPNRGIVELKYYIENATSHVLTFAVSTASNKHFIIQGTRATSLRLLPFTRQKLYYVLFPTGDVAKKPFPEFRVYDTTYKKVLGIVTECECVYQEAGSWRLKEWCQPL